MPSMIVWCMCMCVKIVLIKIYLEERESVCSRENIDLLRVEEAKRNIEIDKSATCSRRT